MPAVGEAVIVVGQRGGVGGGGVSADDQFQPVWRFSDERNDEAAIEVSGPDVVDLRGHGG